MTRSAVLFTSLALLAGCGAPAAAPPPRTAGPATVIATETEILVSLGAAPAVPPEGVEAPPERVLAALQQVYAELEIPGGVSTGRLEARIAALLRRRLEG